MPPTASQSIPIDPALKKDLYRLFEITGFRQLMMQQVDQMMLPAVAMLKANPSVSPQFVDEWARRFREQIDLDEVERVAADEYARYFTREEIDEMIAYQESPVGRKAVRLMPQMMSDLGSTLAQSGRQLGARIGAEIAREHPEYIKRSLPKSGATSIVVPNLSDSANAPSPGSSTWAVQGQAVPAAIEHSTAAKPHPVKTVAPQYPPLAKEAGIQGVVHFSAVIGKDGKVESLRLIDGHPLLVPAARDAARQWEFAPVLIDGSPARVTVQIEINFVLAASQK